MAEYWFLTLVMLSRVPMQSGSQVLVSAQLVAATSRKDMVSFSVASVAVPSHLIHCTPLKSEIWMESAKDHNILHRLQVLCPAHSFIIESFKDVRGVTV